MMSAWPLWAGAQARQPLRRSGALLALLGTLVAATHLWLVDRLAEDRFGWGQGEAAMRRIDVAFVRELAQQPPPVQAPRIATPKAAGPARLAAVAKAAVPQPAGSQPEAVAAAVPDAAASSPPQAASDPVEAVVAAASAPVAPDAPSPAPPEPAAPALETAAASAPAPAAVATAPARPAFEWPPSTRLSYRLLGNYRGPVEGRAQVEWLRSGQFYQVHLEASVTPFLTRRVSSEGELTEQGLAPRTMNGEQRVLLRAPRRWSLKFAPDKVTLADGREEAALPGMQDEASQFVQLTWLFTTQPELLRVGRTLELPLALSRRLERWTFEVKAEESLNLPFGEVATFHVKPRREIVKGGDMVAQIWFAPSLQYLPVRILIHQDAETWIDLQLEKPPLQAAR